MKPEGAALPREGAEGEPLFAEPWQAQALAIADSLVAAGRFTAAEWSEALGAEIRRAAAAGEPDTQATYYAATLREIETQLGHIDDVLNQPDIQALLEEAATK